MEMIISDVKLAVRNFYATNTRSLNLVRYLFETTNDKIKTLTPVLEALCIPNLYGIEDITDAVFGRDSDEFFVLQEFLYRMEYIKKWNTNDMWNGFQGNERLKRICCG